MGVPWHAVNRKNVSPPDDMAARNTQRSLVLSLFCFCIVFALLQPAAAAVLITAKKIFRRLTSAAAQPGALDDRDAAGGLSLDVNPGASFRPKTAYGPRGPVGSPVPNAVDYRKIGNRNKDQLFHLRSNLEIPDEGEMAVQIDVNDDVIVDHVEVNVRGLYHEHASDLKITLKHLSEVTPQPTVPTNATPVQTEELTKKLRALRPRRVYFSQPKARFEILWDAGSAPTSQYTHFSARDRVSNAEPC